MAIVLADVLVAGYQSGGTDGGGNGTPTTGELELADSIEKPAASGDDAPTESVSFNFGQVKVDYFAGTAKSGMEGGAGRDLLVGGLGSDNAGHDAGEPVFTDIDVTMQDAPASFFAFDASFRGGVDVPSASQGSGYAGQVDIASFSWSAETSAAEAEAAESMGAMKKAWKDASASDHSGGVSIAVGDIDGSSSAPGGSGGIDVMIAEIGERDSFAFADSTSVSSLDGQTVRMFFRSGTDHISGGGGDDLLIGGETALDTLPIDVLASMGDTGSAGVSGRITAIASDPSDAPTLLFGDFDLV